MKRRIEVTKNIYIEHDYIQFELRVLDSIRDYS